MRHIIARIALLAVLPGCGPMVVTGGTPTTASVIRNGDELLTAMYNRYSSRWYRTLTFIQKSTYYRTDGSLLRTETWYEAAAFPGRLRIDLGLPSRGNGVVYRADSNYQVQGGRVTQARFGGNPLLTLGFDVYTQPTHRTADQLRREYIDLRRLRIDTLDGRRVYVVGAARGDSTTNQFWVDAQRLLFVRLIQTESGRTRDIRFERYTQYGSAWVSEEVRILVGGRLSFHEEYSQVRVNVSLDDDLFLPERWSTATHWYRP
jgi:hypothetical protein